MLTDIAILSGGQVISKEVGLKLDSVTIELLGQARQVILTKDEKMVLTPTYHVFEMFKSYQDGTALPVEIQSAW